LVLTSNCIPAKRWAFLLVYSRNICPKLYVMCSPYIITTYWQGQSCATHAALNHIKYIKEYFSIIWKWKWSLFLFVCILINWLTKRKNKYIEATSFQTLLCFQIITWLSSLGSHTMQNNIHWTQGKYYIYSFLNVAQYILHYFIIFLDFYKVRCCLFTKAEMCCIIYI
jgi:hypothetical protein